jgi:hypothetical protein
LQHSGRHHYMGKNCCSQDPSPMIQILVNPDVVDETGYQIWRKN